ncbi:DTW-domain-containing protein [Martensiomyces pterosporus]|nr:DTW-domain-containing protein [Martensiomyces pterosporus]
MDEIKAYDIGALKINPGPVLDSCDKRVACSGCGKKVKFFCYHCHKATEELEGRIPHIRLPFKLSVVKHANELDGKSTAIHSKIVAPEDVEIISYSETALSEIDAERTVLLFPGPDAKDIAEVDRKTFDRAVVIDGTWAQAKSMVRNNPKLTKLQKVTIKPRKTRFWRYQNVDDSYLATIEAIYFLYRDSVGDGYCGEHDALMYFFKYFYDFIQSEYAAMPHKKFNTRHQKDYIAYETAAPHPGSRQDKRDTTAKVSFDFDHLPLDEMLQNLTSEPGRE